MSFGPRQHNRRLVPPKIQIVVSRVGDSGGTDIKVTTMTREVVHQARSRLPPLILPGDNPAERQTRNRLLSPGRPVFRTRSPSPSLLSQTGSEKTLSSGGFRSPTARSGQSSSSIASVTSLPASPTSRFHTGCVPPEIPPRPIRRAGGSRARPCHADGGKSCSLTLLTSPYHLRPRSGVPKAEEDLDPEKVEAYITGNPTFLDNYVTKHVDMDTLQAWMVERHKGANTRKLSLSRWRFGNGSDKCKSLKTLAVQMHRSQPEGNVLWELALCISSAVSASSFVIYLFDPDLNLLMRFSPLKEGEAYESFNLDDGGTLATYVCRRREPLRMSRTECLAKFPNGLGDNNENLEGSFYVLCHPIIKSDGEIIGVIEFHRQDVDAPFYKEDEEIVNSYLVWGGIALHYADLNSTMNKQKKLNDFLLSVVRSIFQDMVSMDAVIKKVMNFAQRLVDADRASLFLVDSKTKELYARIFDMGSGNEPTATGSETAIDTPVKEIRFPMATGIAGQVATTGGILNIPDAYKDERFNRGVDQVTGYVTKTILCMPVFIRSTIIGVVQMVNKKRGLFTKDDEESFETFAVYCGLALHHAKLYDKIRRSEQKYKVALEVLSYHNTCSEEEFESARAMGVPKSIIGLEEYENYFADFYFKPMSVDGLQKVYYTVFMFVDLFGLSRFDLDSLYKFVLTVKKNYRSVPYHNWSHGWSVANAMYCILKKTTMFRPLECLALFVGCLCHDLDHRGKNNKFMLESASPLAAIYSTSTMEHHHFNQTVTILQQDGHNIFGKLSSDEYKQVLGNIKHCILATDLALFFTNKTRIEQLFDKDSFSWGVSDHRLLCQAIAMTASDLCASAKPWDIQCDTVKVIFEEFYQQGDLEKRAGRTPIPMMNRDRADELPASQVGFLTGICIPCYDILNKLIPETHPLLDGCKVNLARWREMAEEQSVKKKLPQQPQPPTRKKSK